MTAVRPGTAVLPRPGSSASRTPVTAVGGRPAAARASATREDRPLTTGSPPPTAVAGARRARPPGPKDAGRGGAGAQHGRVARDSRAELGAAGQPNRSERREGDRRGYRDH